MTVPKPGSGVVMVGVDGSVTSDVALAWAADEAARRGWPLTIVHALSEDTTEAFLREATLRAHELQPALHVTTELTRGSPGERLGR